MAAVDAAVGEVGGLVERDLRGTWLVARVAESIFGQDLPGGEGRGGAGDGYTLTLGESVAAMAAKSRAAGSAAAEK